MSVCDLDTLAAEVQRLAALIRAPAELLPTFGRTEDGARPHLEFDGRQFHFVVVERGQELERISSVDPDDVLFCAFEAVTASMAIRAEVRHRRLGEDSRRQIFQAQVALMHALSPSWGQRTRNRLNTILARHPFTDSLGPTEPVGGS